MKEFFTLIRDFYSDIFFLLNRSVFDFGGTSVSVGHILLSCIVVSMIVTIFWKGARG